MRPQARSHPILLAAIMMAAVVLVLAFSLAGCSKQASTSRGQQAIPVQTAAVQVGDLSSVSTLSGTVIANVQTNVGSKVSGIVDAVSVDMGDAVSDGQVLAQLDTVDLEKQLAQAQAQIQVDQAHIPDAQTTLDRDKQLQAAGAASQETVDGDQATLEADQATLTKDQAAAAILQQQITEMTITSPVDGIVAARDIEVGEEVSTSTALFSIAQLDPLQVTVNVSEQIIADIKPGAIAKITVPEVGTTEFQGTVTNVSPVLSTSSASYPVDIRIANPDQRIQPGMTASVQFSGLNTSPGIIIPVQAIEETPQGSEVFTVENNTAHLNMVQIGATSSTQAVVTSGLQAGEQVVITGQDLLSDGVRVTVVQNANQAGVQGMINQLQGAPGARRGSSGAGRQGAAGANHQGAAGAGQGAAQ